MARPKVLATRPLFPAAQKILNANCEVDYWTQPERISKEELFRRCGQGGPRLPAHRKGK